MKGQYRIISLLIVLTLVFSVNINIIAARSARTIGLGDGFAVITGSDALYTNPAAVSADDRSFNLELKVAAEAWNNLLFNDYIPQSKMKDTLHKISKNGMVVNGNGNLGGNLSIGPVTVFADIRADGLAKLSPDFTKLFFAGEVEDGKQYRIDGTAFFASSYLDTGVNLSLKMPDSVAKSLQVERLYLGMSYHYLAGAAVKSSGTGSIGMEFDQDGDPYISGNTSQLNARYSDLDNFKVEQLATGSAFDVGVYAELNDRLSLGVSLLNLGASLKVDQALYHQYTFAYEDSDGDGQKEWDTDDDPEEGLLSGGFELKLPTIFKVGGKYNLSDSFAVLANFTNKSYSDQIFTKTLSDQKFSLAAEYIGLRILPLRLGVNYSTLQRDFDLAAGFGLHLGPLKLDVGLADLTGLFNQSKGVAGGLNARIEF